MPTVPGCARPVRCEQHDGARWPGLRGTPKYHGAMSQSVAASSTGLVHPSVRELFIAFLRVGISGFGGVLPFAHRMLVEQQRWLDEREFVDVLSLCQFLPGPNIVNISIVVGRRFAGPRGALAAFTGLIMMPFCIIVSLGFLYARFGNLPHVREVFGGVASGAAGLVIAVAVRIARPLRSSKWQATLAMVTFLAIAVLRLPLVWVLAALIPVGLLLAHREKP